MRNIPKSTVTWIVTRINQVGWNSTKLVDTRAKVTISFHIGHMYRIARIKCCTVTVFDTNISEYCCNDRSIHVGPRIIMADNAFTGRPLSGIHAVEQNLSKLNDWVGKNQFPRRARSNIYVSLASERKLKRLHRIEFCIGGQTKIDTIHTIRAQWKMLYDSANCKIAQRTRSRGAITTPASPMDRWDREVWVGSIIVGEFRPDR